MWYSIVISVLLVLCLVLYFILSRKLKMPTVATEIMTTKYNKKIFKLERFCKINKLDIDKEKLISKTEQCELTKKSLLDNVITIQNIAKNFEDIEEIYISKNKDEAQNKINNLKTLAPLKIFADELKIDKSIYDIFETFNVGLTKLNFEFQQYLGSQNCVNIGVKQLIFVSSNEIVVVDGNNIFECNSGTYSIEIFKSEAKDKLTDNAHDYFTLKLYFNGCELFSKEIMADSDNVKNYLTKSKFFKKK